MASRLILPALVVVTFFATIYVLRVRGMADETSPPRAPPVLTRPAPAAPPVAAPAVVAPRSAAAAGAAGLTTAPIPETSDQAPSAAVSKPEDARDQSNELVPVMIRLGRDDGSGRSVSIRNSGSEPLNLLVTTADAGQAVRVSIPPFTSTDLTQTMGFVAPHGDRMTVASPPYRERVVQVQ